MGTDTGTLEERPAHTVELASFYIGRYPVTNADYKRYMDDIERPFELDDQLADHPIVGVSWHDARGYAEWAGARLPSEAEWEKAAGWDAATGSKRQFPWGDTFDPERCNSAEAGRDETTAVGSFSPLGDSPYGCADMSGNVWEWTSSLERPYPYRVDDGREDAAYSGLRVLRGGSNGTYRESVTTTFRGWNEPIGRNWYDGFRIAVSAGSEEHLT
jgi:formylglycine-generating enzyme required for sulfatase activity